MNENRNDEDNWKGPDEASLQQETSLTRAKKHSSATGGRFQQLWRRNKTRQELPDEERRASTHDDEKLAVDAPVRRYPLWARTLLWILRKSIAPLIMIVMLLAGLYIGYVIMGDQPKEEAFKFSTYKHLWDLIFAES